jgi:AAA domain (dynein-related subfamily)
MRRNTKQYLITEMLEAGKSRRETYDALRPMVEMQNAPMVFRRNVGGHRVPYSIGEQLRMLGYAINRIANSLDRYNDAEDFEFGEMEDAEKTPVEETPTPVEESPDDDIAEDAEEKKPRKSVAVKLEDAKRHFLAEVRRIREFCESRAMVGETIDEISMRPIIAGSRLLHAGIPGEALLHAMTLHWPVETRRDAAIADFDFTALSARIMADRGITEIVREDGTKEIPHNMFGYVLTLLENRQPAMLIGMAGTGKSTLGAQISDFLGCAYSETPMATGASRGDLLGRHTINPELPFISAEFVERFSGGGIQNMEEIDAADPGTLIVLNNAMESGKLYNPVSGEIHTRHPDFMLYATANTFGLGANRQYTGREKLDAATIDRWRMGRVILPIDSAVEESILGI